MEFASVYHKTSEQMSYALDENQLVVNIKTGYDVKKNFYPLWRSLRCRNSGRK